MTPLPHHIQQQSTDRKLEQLQQHGISVRQIFLKSRKSRENVERIAAIASRLALEVQLNALERDRIPAGVQVHLIRAPRGSYIRTPDGKFFAIRQPPSASATSSKPLPMAPPFPPPAPSSTDTLNSFLFGKIDVDVTAQHSPVVL